MKQIVFFIIFILTVTSCATKTKSLNGNWRQIFLGYEDTNENGFVSDSALITLNLAKSPQIIFDYNDGLAADSADSIILKYPNLNFRKQNYNKTHNIYQMQYVKECDCFNGKFKSYNGRSVLVKWVR